MRAHPSQSTNFIWGSPLGRTEQLPPMSGRDKGKRERTFSKPRAAIVHPPHLEHWILIEAAPGSEEDDREQCRHQLGGKIFSHQHYGDSGSQYSGPDGVTGHFPYPVWDRQRCKIEQPIQHHRHISLVEWKCGRMSPLELSDPGCGLL